MLTLKKKKQRMPALPILYVWAEYKHHSNPYITRLACDGLQPGLHLLYSPGTATVVVALTIFTAQAQSSRDSAWAVNSVSATTAATIAYSSFCTSRPS